jgi:hypothetical protein
MVKGPLVMSPCHEPRGAARLITTSQGVGSPPHEGDSGQHVSDPLLHPNQVYAMPLSLNLSSFTPPYISLAYTPVTRDPEAVHPASYRNSKGLLLLRSPTPLGREGSLLRKGVI